MNKLAKNLQIVFDGMNIDGVRTDKHSRDLDLDIIHNEEMPESPSVCSPTADMLGD